MAACDVGFTDLNTDRRVDSVALEGLMSRGRRASVLLRQKNGDKEGVVAVANDLTSVSLEERRADVDKALVWLKQEMIAMRRQDQELVKQLMGIRSMIQKLKRRQQEDPSDSSESEDDGCVDGACVTKFAETRHRKLSSGGLNGLSTISRIRKSRSYSCTTGSVSSSIDEDAFQVRLEDKKPL
ncbi:uncharacterized protein LOC134183486 isoform X2 [Corticium candelabrum]|uniref:uncharacterized protein LOC134183486 isoform X2 n=1 Tax=Corticium candelabrum TaxID=121492 RepID=UPI002E271F41|nr:uncharacterized protein LOC134183486 isoform X2 [Corticium candelabrum]